MSNSLRPHELQHALPSCPSPIPGVHPNPSIKSVMPSNHLILYHPLLLLPSIFLSIRVFSNESALRIRWPIFRCSISTRYSYHRRGLPESGANQAMKPYQRKIFILNSHLSLCIFYPQSKSFLLDNIIWNLKNLFIHLFDCIGSNCSMWDLVPWPWVRVWSFENSAVATGLEKVSFHSNLKERQCQRMLKLLHNCTHFTC